MEKTVSDRCFHTGWGAKVFKTALECDGLYDNPWTDAGSGRGVACNGNCSGSREN